MKCSNCGNELNEGDMFCNKCGNKVEENYEIAGKENSNNITEQETSEQYKSKLAQANNAGVLFLKQEKHNLLGYNQVCALYGEVERIGSHIPETFIDELDFFVKANLLDDGIFFNTVERFEKVFDNLVGLAINNLKTEKEIEDLKEKYNKDKIISEFQKKLEEKKEKQKQASKPVKIFFEILIGATIVLMIVSVIQYYTNRGTSTSTNNNVMSEKNEVKYGSSKYEDSIYGEKVVKAYYNNYGGVIGVGEIKSITESKFLEKDNYGRYAFKVTFKYYPKNKARYSNTI